MPELRVLVVEDVANFPWDCISAPLLGVVETWQDGDGVTAFLCRHPSIHRLHYSGQFGVTQIKGIAKALVNLNSLLLANGFEGLFREIDPDIPFPLFPKLRTLELDTQSSHLSLQDFEQLVRLRCLPRQPLDKPEFETISSLSIRLPKDNLDSAPWRQSSLLAHIQQSVKEKGLSYTFTLEMRGHSPI
jgi:hypothetical protein